MPRTDDLKTGVPRWASASGSEKNLNVRVGEAPLTPTRGYESIYSEIDGSKPRRQQFNQMFYWITTLINELNQHGLLEWDSAVAYQHPAAVIASDGRIYVSKQNSTNQDPVSDSAETYWQDLSPTDRLLPVNNGPAGSYLNGQKTWGSLTADLSTRLVPAANGSSGQFLGHDKTWRDPSITLASDGRLLPAADGASGTYLAHDKTFRALPGRTRTELWFGDLRFYRTYDGSPNPPHRRYHELTGNYVITDWDWIELYVRNLQDNAAGRRLFQWSSAPGNIPQNALTTDLGVETPGQADATTNGFSQFLAGKSTADVASEINLWRSNNGRLVAHAWLGNSGTYREYHFSLYGVRY